MNISSWAIKNPVPVVLLFIILTMLGIFSFIKLPVQSMPEADLPVIYVMLTQEGASPAQLETEVARKAEDSISSLGRLDYIQTTITDGMVSIMVVFEIGKNPETALNEVRNAVESIRQDLPPDVNPPSVSKEVNETETLITYVVNSSLLNEAELSWFADNEITKAILSVRGVGEVERIGGVNREIHVEPDENAMAAFGITAFDISRLMQSIQADYSGGLGNINGNRQTIRTAGGISSVEELGKLSVPVSGGRLITLSDFATITDTYAERTSITYFNGEKVIALQIKRAKGYSDVDVTGRLKLAMADLSQKYPDINIREAYTTIGPTVDNYDSSMHMLYEGALIAIFIVFLFLRNGRATVISAVSLPLSIIPAFIVMYLAGFGLNVISLIALSLVIGILVDDSIVEVENIARHLTAGKTSRQAAIEATKEIGLAVVATTLTLVSVFLPTAFMSGIAGIVFRQFGITAAAAILASLMVARLLTPVLAAKWMKPSITAEKPEGKTLSLYLRFASFCLNHRKLTMAAVGAFMLASISLTALLSGGFIPAQDVSRIEIRVTLPPGSAIEQTEAATMQAGKIIAGISEVQNVFTAVGMISSGDDPAADTNVTSDLSSATLTAVLSPLSERKRGQAAIEQEIRQLLKAIPGVRVEVGGGDGSKLELALTGGNGALLDETATRLEAEMRTIKGIGNVYSSAALEAPEIIIKPDYTQAALYGITSQDIANILRTATSGNYLADLSKLSLPERQIPVRVKFNSAGRNSLDQISQMKISTQNGVVTLGQIADISIGSGPSMIVRRDRERNVTITAELNGRSIGDVTAEAMALPLLKNLPPDVKVAEHGDAENMSGMFLSFLMAMVIGLFCVYSVLVLLFKDFMQPVTILTAIPLALGGALLPLVITGTSFSMAAAIGLLMLMGIVTKNSILIVEYIIMARQNGMARLEAILDACRKRARPIIMTTMAMIGGMLPVVIGLGGGDPSFRKPMAIVVIGGLLTSTFLSLVVIPVVYTLIDDLERKFFRKEKHI